MNAEHLRELFMAEPVRQLEPVAAREWRGGQREQLGAEPHDDRFRRARLKFIVRLGQPAAELSEKVEQDLRAVADLLDQPAGRRLEHAAGLDRGRAVVLLPPFQEAALAEDLARTDETD